MTRARLNVIEMLRVSSDKQDVTRQEFDMEQNREDHHLNVLRTIRLKISGTLVMTHPEVQQMIAELSRPGVDAISISAIDRLFRPKDYESLKMFDFFARNGKLIVSTKEGVVDPASDKGWDICIGAAQRAGAELRELKRRTNGGRKKSHARGLMCNGSACYGMVYVSRYERDAQGKAQYLKEDPVESSIPGLSKRQVVIDVFSWRHFHKMHTYAIVKRLNAAGIRSARGGLWSRQTVIQMLKNSSYIGQHHEGDSVFSCPKFIEMEVFQGVQEMFAEAKRHHNGRPTRQYLFSGLDFTCTPCGFRMISQAGSKRRCVPPGYRCGNIEYKPHKRRCNAPRVQQAKVETVGFSAIWRHMTQPELLLANAQAYYDSLPKHGTAKLELELADVTRRMERTQRMVRMGAMDEDKGITDILTDKQRITEIQGELRAAGSVLTLPPLYAVEAAMRRIAEGPEPQTFAERRPVLEKVVDLKVRYFEGTLNIEGKVPVPEPVQGSGSNRRNCNSRFHEYP